ncbi:hypothetical protein SSP24_06110 [Streptomyces spinoverrucosus]|uniref:Uncharacterized protein n=1 Tax=Streptomyces spinoverrucosus TaxID=284043 RepID=A0A4Y3VDA2_9ACTN|nr:hypothetical protein [Streptomyces spinoverrucosus]GEC02956.1 hypothetical protein SSP24_06110 [Streptomyces spinoverrucosus]GHB39306.1 hypothetical protein GCM10010397_06480 [Streptomyces spinoverrucosus]
MANLNLVPVPVATGIADVAAQAVAASGGGDAAPVGPGRFLYVANGDAASKTVTIATPGTVSGLAVADASLVVAAGDHGIIPLANVYRGANGRAAITYSAVTGVTVAAFELGSS